MASYRMPAEWESHRGTLLAWPHRASDWPGKFTTIPWVYGEIVRTLARYELVTVVIRDAKQQQTAKAILDRAHADAANIHFLTKPTNRGWMRDSGPIVVRGGDQCVVLDWHFNAWAKYDDWQLDDKVPLAIAKVMKWTREQPMWENRRIVLEGGSIDVNGRGLLLTTEECLLSDVQERNPGFTRRDYENVFAKYLGIERVIWLGRGIAGDDTHGHIDDLSRFVNADTVVTVIEENETDANFAPLRENLERLRAVPGLEVVKLPMPSPIVFRHQLLPASYANFYIANGVVIVPTFNDKNDRIALGVLAELFPDRDVIGIHCVDLVWGLGTLHCLTQQLPNA
jgi:agmatine deiminase